MKEDKLVTTFDGTRARRSKCRYIKTKYYEMNRQCFKVGEKYHRINNGKITKDHEKEKYVLKGARGLSHGIVGRLSSGDPEYGYFSPNIIRNIRIESNNMNSERCLSEEVATSLGYQEALSTGYYHDVDKYTGSSKKEVREYLDNKRTQPRDFYGFPIHYGAGPMIRDFTNHFKQFEPIGTVQRAIANSLPNFTYGVEYETSRGTIPERLLYKNGLIACRDGSIGGFEYVTVPMSGIKGIQAIQNHSALLNKYCMIDNMCALHIHLGGYPQTKEAVVALHRLLVVLQDYLYGLFPHHYRDTSYFKRMNYCGSLRAVGMSGGVDGAFQRVFEMMTSGHGSFKGFGAGHPMDMSGEHKWNVSPRYKWASIIPLVFGERGTVEFRIHTPTRSADKVINWLYIIAAILAYARDNQAELLKSRISKEANVPRIIQSIYGKSSNITDALTSYLSYRRKLFNGQNDPIGDNEVANDINRLPDYLRVVR